MRGPQAPQETVPLTGNQDDVPSILRHGLKVAQPLIFTEDIEAAYTGRGQGKDRELAQAILEQEALGFLKPLEGDEKVCLSPCFNIKKANSSHLRMVLDCRLSNVLCEPRPALLESNKALIMGKFKNYTKMDMGSCFLSFKLHPSQEGLYALKCPVTHQKFKFTRLIWGSSTAPAACVGIVTSIVSSVVKILTLEPDFDFAKATG